MQFNTYQKLLLSNEFSNEIPDNIINNYYIDEKDKNPPLYKTLFFKNSIKTFSNNFRFK